MPGPAPVFAVRTRLPWLQINLLTAFLAATTAAGVALWSGSLGLVLVIAISISMALSMVIAGMAGAAIPLLLTMLGQDPAQSSSILLTTITDVAGFFSFLGIATLMVGML